MELVPVFFEFYCDDAQFTFYSEFQFDIEPKQGGCWRRRPTTFVGDPELQVQHTYWSCMDHTTSSTTAKDEQFKPTVMQQMAFDSRI